MKDNCPLSAPFAILSLGLLAVGCSSGSTSDPNNRGPFEVVEISTGSAAVYPYRIRALDALGSPTNEIVEIHSMDDLRAHSTGNNLVLPNGVFPTGQPTLPDGRPGNQFFKVRFSHDLDATSILSVSDGAATNSSLTTALAVLGYHSETEVTQTLRGRGFVGGQTVITDDQGNRHLAKVLEADGDNVRILDSYVGSDGVRRPVPAGVAQGFPRGFSNAAALASAKTFVFVADTDADLSTFESFPDVAKTGQLLQIAVSNAVLDTQGQVLEKEVCTVTTVGPDNRPPEVIGYASNAPSISPGGGARGVDPTATILVRFNKPVQPTDMGTFFDSTNLAPSGGGATLEITFAARTFTIPYYATPISSGDFCNYEIRPAYHLPGEAKVDVSVNNTIIRNLQTTFLGNTVRTDFTTGQGPGLVNAPVAPDALYVGMTGNRPGLKIIDLNGFGQTTGGYAVDPSGNVPPVFDWRNTTRFWRNPNIGSPGLTPNLTRPTDLTATGLDAGSPGVFRLIQDSAGETLLLGAPVLGSVADIHIGCPLDMVFNNANINVNASHANHRDAFGGVGLGNGFTIVPHPNPPPLVFPHPNPAMGIAGQEPTTTNTACVQQPLNLLVAGNPEGPPALGLFGHYLEIFNGPAPRPGSPPPPTPYCPFGARQQIGHFLYVLDGDNQSILVVNSNRMRVLDTIRLPDPVDLAMASNLRELAISNASSNAISFLDIDPTSATFHQVIAETKLPGRPGKIAWQPDGEDILVLLPEDDALVVINASDRRVQKTIQGQLRQPVGLAVSDRHANGRGNSTGLYFAYILNANGTVAVYESGPDGVNGIGFNDIIGTVPDVLFRKPKHIAVDINAANTGAFITHEDESGRGMVSRLEMTVSPGTQPIAPNSNGFVLPPTYRQKVWAVTQTYGGGPSAGTKDLLSGSPGEVTTDEMFNFADLPNQTTPRNGSLPQSPFLGSEKGHIKNGSPAIRPKFLFVAIVDRGRVDVFDIGTAEKVRSIDMGGIPAVLGSYWRQ